MNKTNILSIARDCVREGKIFLVGGAIRESLLENESFDFDFAVEKKPQLTATNFSKAIKGSFVVLDCENKVFRVVKKMGDKTYYFDFAGFKGKTIVEDLLKRDITINAVAMKLDDVIRKGLSRGAILKYAIDPAGGIADIKLGKIRVVSERAFTDDPIRMIRVFRFAAAANFSIEKKTLILVKKHSALVSKSSMERVRDELLKTFASRNSSVYINQMESAGLLAKILPEIKALKKSAKRFYFHPHGLWHHLTETLAAAELLYRNLKKHFPNRSSELESLLKEPLPSGSKIAVLKYTILLHDLGKPSTIKRINRRIRFFGHEIIGSKMFECVSRRLKLSNEEINIGKSLIQNHMRILQLVGSGDITERATYRLMRDMGNNLIPLAILSLADAMSYRKLPGFEKNNIKDILKFTRTLIDKYFEKREEMPQKKIINGDILMKKLRLKPGPLIGKLLTAIEEERNLKKIQNRSEALLFANKLLKSTEYRKDLSSNRGDQK